MQASVFLSAAYEPAPVEGSQTASQPVSRNKHRQEPAVCRGGHNDRYADKLLVLIDGRSLYSSAQSGVFWEVQNLMLEDIERIEIIRGPGATLWGAGAVNGVINIITKRANDTQGGLVLAGGGGTSNSTNRYIL